MTHSDKAPTAEQVMSERIADRDNDPRTERWYAARDAAYTAIIEAHDEFTRGYLIAVSNLISHMGASTQSSVLLATIGATPEMIAGLGFTEFDVDNLTEGLRDLEKAHD